MRTVPVDPSLVASFFDRAGELAFHEERATLLEERAAWRELPLQPGYSRCKACKVPIAEGENRIVQCNNDGCHVIVACNRPHCLRQPVPRCSHCQGALCFDHALKCQHGERGDCDALCCEKCCSVLSCDRCVKVYCSKHYDNADYRRVIDINPFEHTCKEWGHFCGGCFPNAQYHADCSKRRWEKETHNNKRARDGEDEKAHNKK